MIYYIYLHIKLDSGEPFYLGKGKDRRAYSKQGRSKWWKNIVAKYDYDIILLEEGLNEEKALEREIYWIKRIGRKDLNEGPLINLTDGGDGINNPSLETREKMRNNKLGKKAPWSSINAKKMSESNIGKPSKMKGKPRSEETKAKIANKLKGRPSPNKGNKFSEELIQKIIETKRLNRIKKK